MAKKRQFWLVDALRSLESSWPFTLVESEGQMEGSEGHPAGSEGQPGGNGQTNGISPHCTQLYPL